MSGQNAICLGEWTIVMEKLELHVRVSVRLDS